MNSSFPLARSFSLLLILCLALPADSALAMRVMEAAQSGIEEEISQALKPSAAGSEEIQQVINRLNSWWGFRQRRAAHTLRERLLEPLRKTPQTKVPTFKWTINNIQSLSQRISFLDTYLPAYEAVLEDKNLKASYRWADDFLKEAQKQNVQLWDHPTAGPVIQEWVEMNERYGSYIGQLSQALLNQITMLSFERTANDPARDEELKERLTALSDKYFELQRRLSKEWVGIHFTEASQGLRKRLEPLDWRLLWQLGRPYEGTFADAQKVISVLMKLGHIERIFVSPSQDKEPRLLEGEPAVQYRKLEEMFERSELPRIAIFIRGGISTLSVIGKAAGAEETIVDRIVRRLLEAKITADDVKVLTDKKNNLLDTVDPDKPESAALGIILQEMNSGRIPIERSKQTLRAVYFRMLAAAAAGAEEEYARKIEEKLRALSQRDLPELKYRRLGTGEPVSFVYQDQGPIVFAIDDQAGLQHYRIRRKRTTGEFIVGPVAPVLNDPSLHPHLLVFNDQMGFGGGIPLPVGQTVRLGNRELLIEAESAQRHKMTLKDLGSSRGTSLVEDVRTGDPEDLSHRISREDWDKAETILKVLGGSIVNRNKKDYDRRTYAAELADVVGSWTSLGESIQRALLTHLLVVRGWVEGDVLESLEWLRRFFRIYHHVFYMTPEAAGTQGQQGLILLGRVRRYTPVNWRGFRTITQVEPLITNMEGGFKPGTNDDEVIVLLDSASINPKLIGLHEARHQFDMLEFTQYGMKSIGARVGRGDVKDLQQALGLLAIQGWELEFTAYAVTMIQIGKEIQAKGAEVSVQEILTLIGDAFGGAEYLEHYLKMGESREEHIRASRQFLERFYLGLLKSVGEDRLLSDVEAMEKDLLMRELKLFIRSRLGLVNMGQFVQQTAEKVLNEFYLEKLGYVPQYPDVMAMADIEVLAPDQDQPIRLGYAPGLSPELQFVYTRPALIQVAGNQFQLRTSASQQGVLTLQQGKNAQRLQAGFVYRIENLELSYLFRDGKFDVTIRNTSERDEIVVQAAGAEERKSKSSRGLNPHTDELEQRALRQVRPREQDLRAAEKLIQTLQKALSGVSRETPETRKILAQARRAILDLDRTHEEELGSEISVYEGIYLRYSSHGLKGGDRAAAKVRSRLKRQIATQMARNALTAGAEELPPQVLIEMVSIKYLRTRALMALGLPEDPYGRINKILDRLHDVLGGFGQEDFSFNQKNPSLYRNPIRLREELSMLRDSFLQVKGRFQEKQFFLNRNIVIELDRILDDLLDAVGQDQQGSLTGLQLKEQLAVKLQGVQDRGAEVSIGHADFAQLMTEVRRLATQMEDKQDLEELMEGFNTIGFPTDSIAEAVRIYLEKDRLAQLEQPGQPKSLEYETAWELAHLSLSWLRPLQSKVESLAAKKMVGDAIRQVEDAARAAEIGMMPENMIGRFEKAWVLVKEAAALVKQDEIIRQLMFVAVRLHWVAMRARLDRFRSNAQRLLAFEPRNEDLNDFLQIANQHLAWAELYIDGDYLHHVLYSNLVVYPHDLAISLRMHLETALKGRTPDDRAIAERLLQSPSTREMMLQLVSLYRSVMSIDTVFNIHTIFEDLRQLLKEKKIPLEEGRKSNDLLSLYEAPAELLDEFAYKVGEQTCLVSLVYRKPGLGQDRMDFKSAGHSLLIREKAAPGKPSLIAFKLDSSGALREDYHDANQHTERLLVVPPQLGVDLQGRLHAIFSEPITLMLVRPNTLMVPVDAQRAEELRLSRVHLGFTGVGGVFTRASLTAGSEENKIPKFEANTREFKLLLAAVLIEAGYRKDAIALLAHLDTIEGTIHMANAIDKLKAWHPDILVERVNAKAATIDQKFLDGALEIIEKNRPDKLADYKEAKRLVMISGRILRSQHVLSGSPAEDPTLTPVNREPVKTTPSTQEMPQQPVPVRHRPESSIRIPPEVYWQTERGLFHYMQALTQGTNYRRHFDTLEAVYAKRLAPNQRGLQNKQGQPVTNRDFLEAVAYFVQFEKKIETAQDLEALFKHARRFNDIIDQLVINTQAEFPYGHLGALLFLHGYLKAADHDENSNRRRRLIGEIQKGPVAAERVWLPLKAEEETLPGQAELVEEFDQELARVRIVTGLGPNGKPRTTVTCCFISQDFSVVVPDLAYDHKTGQWHEIAAKHQAVRRLVEETVDSRDSFKKMVPAIQQLLSAGAEEQGRLEAGHRLLVGLLSQDLYPESIVVGATEQRTLASHAILDWRRQYFPDKKDKVTLKVFKIDGTMEKFPVYYVDFSTFGLNFPISFPMKKQNEVISTSPSDGELGALDQWKKDFQQLLGAQDPVVIESFQANVVEDVRQMVESSFRAVLKLLDISSEQQRKIVIVRETMSEVGYMLAPIPSPEGRQNFAFFWGRQHEWLFTDSTRPRAISIEVNGAPFLTVYASEGDSSAGAEEITEAVEELNQLIESYRGTIEGLSPYHANDPVMDLTVAFPRSKDLAAKLGYENGLVESIWYSQLPAGLMRVPRKVYVEGAADSRPMQELKERLDGYVTLVDAAEEADLIIAIKRSQVKMQARQALLQVTAETAVAVTPALLKHLETRRLLGGGSIVALDVLLMRQGSLDYDVLLFA